MGVLSFRAAGADVTALTDIDAATLERLMTQGIPVIDIRTLSEWKETGTIEGSERIMAFGADGRLAPDFMARFAEVVRDKDQPFILVCRSSNRTQALGRAMAEGGYSKVMHLDGGILGWRKAGRTVAPCQAC